MDTESALKDRRGRRPRGCAASLRHAIWHIDETPPDLHYALTERVTCSSDRGSPTWAVRRFAASVTRALRCNEKERS